MDLTLLTTALSCAAVLLLAASLFYTGRRRGGPATRQLAVLKTNTPPRVTKPERWRAAAVAALHHPDDVKARHVA